MNIEQVILVNEQDVETGTIEKMEAHRKALLHRAFSVFIFNTKGEMLLQVRVYGRIPAARIHVRESRLRKQRPGD